MLPPETLLAAGMSKASAPAPPEAGETAPAMAMPGAAMPGAAAAMPGAAAAAAAMMPGWEGRSFGRFFLLDFLCPLV